MTEFRGTSSADGEERNGGGVCPDPRQNPLGLWAPAGQAVLTKKQVAAALGCSVRTVDNLTRDGQLAPIRIRGLWRLPVEDLALLITSLSPSHPGGRP